VPIRRKKLLQNNL